MKATTIIEWLEGNIPAGSGLPAAHPAATITGLAGTSPPRGVLPPAGREAQFDFTHGSSLGVTVAGRPYRHQLFQLILSHSGWRYAELANGETFLALQQGLQAALWTLGGVPQVVRSDNTSAATHEMAGRSTTTTPPLEHYGLGSTRINPPVSPRGTLSPQGRHRPGPDAQGQPRLRHCRPLRRLRPADGPDATASGAGNSLSRAPAPSSLPEYANYQAKVRKWSTVQVAGRTYSVPSRSLVRRCGSGCCRSVLQG